MAEILTSFLRPEEGDLKGEASYGSIETPRTEFGLRMEPEECRWV